MRLNRDTAILDNFKKSPTVSYPSVGLNPSIEGSEIFNVIFPLVEAISSLIMSTQFLIILAEPRGDRKNINKKDKISFINDPKSYKYQATIHYCAHPTGGTSGTNNFSKSDCDQTHKA